MKQISKEYCKNAKDFFPIYTSREKKYLQDLRVNIDDFCEDNHITTLNDLYMAYGNPADVAHAYFSSCDSIYIIKKMKFNKIIKRFLASIVIAIFILISSLCLRFYFEYKVFESQRIFFEDTSIE